MHSFHDTMTAFADRMHPVAPRSADMGMAPRPMPMAPSLSSPNAFAARGGRRSLVPTRGLL